MKKIILLFAMIFCFLQFNLAQPGELDSSFGINGIVTADLRENYKPPAEPVKILPQSDGSIFVILQTDVQTLITKKLPNGSGDTRYGHSGFSDLAVIHSKDAALQPDGKIVVVGRTETTHSNKFSLVRFNTDGSLDNTFGNKGKQTTDFGFKFNIAYGVALQSDGKIIAVGTSYNGESPDYPYYTSLARYNNDGSLDDSFSEDGKINMDVVNYGLLNGANSVALQKDGKVLVTLGVRDSPFSGGYILARFNTEGNLDSTFNGNGLVEPSLSFSSSPSDRAAAIQNDGKIVFVTGLNGNFYIFRYNTDGSQDLKFGSDGIQTTDFGGYDVPTSVSILSDGKIAVGGHSLDYPAISYVIACYNTDGSLDSSFSKDGKLTTNFTYDDYLTYISNDKPLAVQSDGKILAAGHSYTGTTSDFVLVRYNTDGSVDDKFEKEGTLPAVFPGYTVYTDTKVQKDGKIVVAGYTNSSNTKYIIARYNTNGSLDSSFSGDGLQTNSFQITSIVIQNDGKIVAMGTEPFLSRYNADGSPDHSFGENGILQTEFQLAAVAVQKDGKIVVASRYYFSIFRYNTDGSVDTQFSAPPVFYNDLGEPLSIYVKSIAVESDGKIVAAANTGSSYNEAVILVYNANGSLSNSRLFSTLDSTIFDITSMAIASNDSIVIAVNAVGPYASNVSLYFFDDNGISNGNFDTNLPFDNYVIAIQDDGKIILGGASALARFNTDRRRDTAFIDGIQKTEDIYKLSSIAIGNNKLYGAGSGYLNSVADSLGVLARYMLDNKTNTSPTVSITTPTNNRIYLAPAQIKLSATASDADGTISKVEFYKGNTLLHTETVAPYGFKWRDVPLGEYTLTAKGYDNNGNVATSAAVHISVVPNKPPTVSIIAPANNEHYAAPAYIHLEAAASDTDGRIARVEFYNGSTLIRTEYKYPYTYVWKGVSEGPYTITAIATDNWGAQTTSKPIVVKVKPENPAIVSSRPSTNKTDLNTSTNLKLHPNPATNILNIHTTGIRPNKPATISIISVSGMVLKKMQMSSSTQSIQLNVTSLAKGVYTVKLTDGDKVVYKQFLKL